MLKKWRSADADWFHTRLRSVIDADLDAASHRRPVRARLDLGLPRPSMRERARSMEVWRPSSPGSILPYELQASMCCNN